MWTLLLGFLSGAIKPVFDFLNARVDANARMHISDNATMAQVGSATLAGASKADELNAQIRLKEGKWAPMVLTSIAGFLFPFAWHTWQVVLDSSRWIPAMAWPPIQEHVVGSWHVAALPGMFETTEHAVINSLFIGASTLLAGAGLIKAIRR
jgi:hypothetical protein